MVVSEAMKYHEEKLEINSEENDIEVTLANASINPKRRTVSWWFDEWRKTNLGTRQDNGAIDVNTNMI